MDVVGQKQKKPHKRGAKFKYVNLNYKAATCFVNLDLIFAALLE